MRFAIFSQLKKKEKPFAAFSQEIVFAGLARGEKICRFAFFSQEIIFAVVSQWDAFCYFVARQKKEKQFCRL